MATYDEITNRLGQDEVVKEFWSRYINLFKKFKSRD